MSLLCAQKFVCTSGYYDSLCLLLEVTCSQELFGGAVDSLVTSDTPEEARNSEDQSAELFSILELFEPMSLRERGAQRTG